MTLIDNKEVGKRIKKIRTEHFGKKMTLEEFGKLLSPPAIRPLVSKWEKGINRPNTERLQQIAELGGVTTDYLLYGKQLNGYGEKIKKIRLDKNYSKEHFAKRIGVSLSDVEDFENENSLPDKSTFYVIAELGETTVDEILWNLSPGIALPIQEQFESTQKSVQKKLSEDEQAKSEFFFSMIETLRGLQMGTEKDKKVFEKTSSLISSLIYLADTGPDIIYPKDSETLENKLDESVQQITNYAKDIKEIVLQKRSEK